MEQRRPRQRGSAERQPVVTDLPGEERVGDVSNVVFCNGMVARKNGDLFIYYASSDSRTHVAVTTIDKMLDYVINTPPDGLRSAASVQARSALITRNLEFLKK